MDDPAASMALLFEPSGRAIRLLHVDAAAAARHDPDVAAGMRELFSERRGSILAVLGELVADPEATMRMIGMIEAGFGAAEAMSVDLTVDRLLPILRSMLTSLVQTDGSPLEPG
jgi:hypothetical protein